MTTSQSIAQVTTDGTVNTQVTQDGTTAEITGGETRGSNLFHSFQDFSVPGGNEAFFNNANDVSNIFSRVTGGNISNIDGGIRANGSASLFLINPAGIVFGEGASLDLGGSFYGSTASSILFEDGEFSAADLENSPLLTVNAPIGLGFRDKPGDIVNRSIANGAGLEVFMENSFALVGGLIILDGGMITASQGTIELGSVEENSIVTLEETARSFKFQFDEITNFADLKLTQGAIVNSNGEINLEGSQVFLQNGSQIRGNTLGSVPRQATSIKAEILLIEDRANISSTSSGEGSAGDINLKASESIKIVGTGFEEFEQTFLTGNILGTLNPNSLSNKTGVFAGTAARGTAGNINLNTSNLSLENGSAVGAFTFGEGATGMLTINVSESMDIVSSGILNLPTLGSTGNGNIIDIDTTNLIVSNSGVIGSVTLGSGDGGNISINTRDKIEILRNAPNSPIPTGIFSNSIVGRGKAGNIDINTQELILQDGGQITSVSGAFTRSGLVSQGGKGGDINITTSKSINISGTSPDIVFTSAISSNTLSNENAGNLYINTNTLIIDGGATITASTVNSGQGGNLTIDASESIHISGSSPDEQLVSNIRSSSGESDTIVEFNSTEATGNAGNLSITTDNLSISNSGRIGVNSLGSGNGGNLKLKADNIQLENKGSIVAETFSGEGGNIILKVDELITLDSNSLISAQAFNQANGGNIDIDANFIFAFPNENNDILASAKQGEGGNIAINTEYLFNIQERTPNDSNNDISASSELGINGTVTFNTPEVDPTSGILELPDIPIDAAEILTKDLCKFEDEKIAGGSSFIITGRGGLTPTSEVSLENRDRIVNWASRNDLEVSSNGAVGIRQRKGQEAIYETYPEIKQSQGLVVAADGDTWLTANASNTILQDAKTVHPDCQTSKSTT